MIKGTGIDIVAIDRIAAMIERYSGHFTNRIFTPKEIDFCSSKADCAIHFAGRWAVKEAFYKALPVGCQTCSTWKSIEVLPPGSQKKGPPVVTVLNEILARRMHDEGIEVVHMSISHEKEMCVAIVILE